MMLCMVVLLPIDAHNLAKVHQILMHTQAKNFMLILNKLPSYPIYSNLPSDVKFGDDDISLNTYPLLTHNRHYSRIAKEFFLVPQLQLWNPLSVSKLTIIYLPLINHQSHYNLLHYYPPIYKNILRYLQNYFASSIIAISSLELHLYIYLYHLWHHELIVPFL